MDLVDRAFSTAPYLAPQFLIFHVLANWKHGIRPGSVKEAQHTALSPRTRTSCDVLLSLDPRIESGTRACPTARMVKR